MLPLSFYTYFKKISVEGKKNYDTKGATLLAVNHPNSFIDPLLIGSVLFGSLHYLAAAEYMGKGFKKWFMQNIFHMVPVYRPGVYDTIKGNQNMFKACHKLMSNGKTLLVHPEGVSVKQLKIQPCKTGLARIALGTKGAYPKLPLKIIPIGLNFTDHHRPLGDVHIKVNPAFYVDSYENSTDGVKLLTNRIEEEMKKTVLHIEEEKSEDIFWQMHRLIPKWRFFENDRETFAFQKNASKKLNHLFEGQNIHFEKILEKANYFEKQINLIGIKQVPVFNQNFKKRRFFHLLFFVLLAPIFLLGMAFHFFPLVFIHPIRKKIKTKPSFKGSMILALGMFLTLIWYVLAGVFLANFGIIFLLFLPLMLLIGRISTLYLTKWTVFIERWKITQWFKKHGSFERELSEWQEQTILFFSE